MRTEHARSWWAVHVFLSDPEATERFLLATVAPTVRKLASEGAFERWFFLRYWEGGPHLRIRFRGLAEPRKAELLETLRSEAALARSPSPITREQYYGAHSFDGAPVDLESLPWFEDGSAEAIDYEPEYDRYGGPEAIELSEQLFELSSNIAMAVLGGTRGEWSKRLQASWALMVAAADAFNPELEEIALFFERYAAFWQGYSQATADLGDRLREAEIDPAQVQALRSLRDPNRREGGAIAAWRSGVASFAAELRKRGAEGRLQSPLDGGPAAAGSGLDDAVANIVGSQIHMLNNRLGVLPSQELMLASRISGAARAARLEAPVGDPAP